MQAWFHKLSGRRTTNVQGHPPSVSLCSPFCTYISAMPGKIYTLVATDSYSSPQFMGLLSFYLVSMPTSCKADHLTTTSSGCWSTCEEVGRFQVQRQITLVQLSNTFFCMWPDIFVTIRHIRPSHWFPSRQRTMNAIRFLAEAYSRVFPVFL